MRRCGLLVITTAQLHQHSLNPGSAQVQILLVASRSFTIVITSRFEKRLNAFLQSTGPQKTFIIIIVIIISEGNLEAPW